MSQHQVEVDGEICIVTCNKTGKTVWTTIGECNEKPVQERGSSERNALEKWKSLARMMND